jgi:hypothetical protein
MGSSKKQQNEEQLVKKDGEKYSTGTKITLGVVAVASIVGGLIFGKYWKPHKNGIKVSKDKSNVSVDGHNIEFDEVCALTKSRAVGRAHLAFLLKQKGWVNSIKQAFEKYIGEGCPGYAPKFKQTPFEAIDLIHQSGGLAVMAHPMLTQKDELIARMAKAGLDGLEVYYPNCSDTVINFYAGLARKHKLLMTGGSDAHGSAKTHTHVGKATVFYETVEEMKKRIKTVSA